jgi:hypothetical protein
LGETRKFRRIQHRYFSGDIAHLSIIVLLVIFTCVTFIFNVFLSCPPASSAVESATEGAQLGRC